MCCPARTHNFTFLIEDPATIWNLGPQRYPAIAERYRPLTTRNDKLAIDINIVERYQNVYPTKQQTGTELFQLVHAASNSFPRVAPYFENSLLAPDLKLLPSAAAAVTRVERVGPKLVVDSRFGAGVPWKGAAKVDGQPWPAHDADTLCSRPDPTPSKRAPPPLLLFAPPERRSQERAHRGCRHHRIHLPAPARAIAITDRLYPVEIDGENVPISSPLHLPRSAPRSSHLPVTLLEG